MYLAGRSHIIKNRSLIDTMRMFHKMGYGGLELSLQHGMGTWLDVNYLDDYVIEKVNEVSRDVYKRQPLMGAEEKDFISLILLLN